MHEEGIVNPFAGREAIKGLRIDNGGSSWILVHLALHPGKS